MRVVIPARLVSAFVKAWNRANEDIDDDYDEATDFLEADEINGGWCYQFALLLKKVYGRKCTLYMDSDHVWVKMSGRFYDSDHRGGVVSVYQLGVDDYRYQHATPQQVIDEWGCRGNSGPVRWDVIEMAYKLYKR